VTGVELIADIINWKWYLLALVVHGIAPGLLLRVIVLAFEKDDPRRPELINELYYIPFIKRPFWVAQQFETALSDGIWPRFVWMLTGRVIYRWKLGNGDKRNKKYPKSFEIPSPQDKAEVQPGDLVKVMFEPSFFPPGSDKIGERMWVRVTKVGRRRLEGCISNDPFCFPRLEYGDMIKFKRKHIIDIDFDGGGEHLVVDAA
jgi:Uncharacterized protein conserved in bacteria (DUF2314)